MSPPASNSRLDAIILTKDMHRLQRIPETTYSQLEPDDWELCRDLDKWDNKETKHGTEIFEQDNRGQKRGRLQSPDSDDGDIISRPQKKLKAVEMEESDGMTIVASQTLSPTSGSLLRIDLPLTRSILSSIEVPSNYSPVSSFKTTFIEPFQSLNEEVVGLTSVQRKNAERQNFVIWEDNDDTDEDNSGAFHDSATTIWTLTYPDENKENEPSEYDPAMDDESVISESEEYYYPEEQMQQGYRGILSEILN